MTSLRDALTQAVSVIADAIEQAKPAPLSAPADRLIRLDAASCAEAGFELRGIKSKIESGELPVVKIGRPSYVRMSDLCAMVKTKTKKETPEHDRSFIREAATPRKRKRAYAA